MTMSSGNDILCDLANDEGGFRKGFQRKEEWEEEEEEGGRATSFNLLNCLKGAISPKSGDIACPPNQA